MENARIKNKKSLLRTHYSNVRCQLPRTQVVRATYVIARRFFDFVTTIHNSVFSIAGYYQIKNELNILQLLQQLNQRGYVCALPRIVQGTRILEFKQWHKGDQLEEKYIPEPLKTAKTLVPDIMIAPLLACDKRGYRLGYGAGYYDKTINTLRQHKPHTLVIGLCFHKQLSSCTLPHEPHDQKLDIIITEKTIIRI